MEQIPETLGEDMRFYRSVLFVWLLTDERRCAWHAACFSFHELVACDPYCHCLVCAAAAGLDVFYIPCTFTAYIEAILCRSASLLHSAKAALARAHVAWRKTERASTAYHSRMHWRHLLPDVPSVVILRMCVWCFVCCL
mgnify:CR=1 FL=1